MGESRSSSMLGSVLSVSQDRDGVRIDAPHGWEINDVHHQWTKNETYHWETGNIFHMTSGQVLHTNLNLAEVHATTNALTTHVDLTPIQVHINQNPIGGIRFHYEPSIRTRSYHYHHGHLVNLNSSSVTEAGEIELHASQKSDFSHAPQLSEYSMAVLRSAQPTTGKMKLKADGEMTLESPTEISLQQTLNQGSLSLAQGQAKLSSDVLTDISSRTKVCLDGNGATATFEHRIVAFNNGNGSSIKCDGSKIQTDSTRTLLNGRVYLGNPETAPPGGGNKRL